MCRGLFRVRLSLLERRRSTMITLPILLHPIEDALVRKVVVSTRLEAVEGIMLLDGDTPLTPEYVYLGTPEDLAGALPRLPQRGVLTFISAGDSELLDSFIELDSVNLIVTSLPLVPLQNKVQRVLCNYLKWIKELEEITRSERGVQGLAEKGFEMIGYPVVILNMGFKMLGGCIPEGFKDPLLQEIAKNGFLSYDSVCSLLDEEAKLTNPFAPKIEYVSRLTGNRTIIRRIYYNGNLVARVIVTLEGEEKNEYCSELASELSEYVQHYFLSTKASQYMASTEMGALIADLIERRLADPEELEHRLKLVPALGNIKYYHTMVVSFEERNRSIPWNYVISQIEQAIPDSCITVYKNDILILAKKQRHNAKPSFDQQRMMEILEYYDAYMAIGNYSKFLTSLRPIYVQTKATIRLGKVFCPDPKNRIFYYEEYSIYHTIDLLADPAHNGYHNGNLIYLCHPALITIERYDKKYGTNLKETLFVYLTNDCNAVKTAKQLYIHRNTLYYKINKIEELIGQKIDDPLLKERLLFSMHVVEYQDKYVNEDLFALKRYASDRRK